MQYEWKNTTDNSSTGANKYEVSYDVKKVGSTSNYVDVSNIVYPASLAYSCDTPAKTNTKTIANSEWPTTADYWQTGTTTNNTESYWTGWDNEVTSTTKTIALRNNVNYGVAKLKATFQLASGPLEDKNDIQVSTPNKGFKVTGLLIGGQKQYADWQYLPHTGTSNNSSNPEVTIYEDFGGDSIFVTSSSASNANYCLVFDNYLAPASGTTEQDQSKVKIAVEFENNTGATFEGHDGIVAKNQKFYLIGELDPASQGNNSSNISWPSSTTGYGDIRFPKENVVRVFIQDHTTSVNFKVNSLANAYINIPDLRTTQMVLGLSVNLDWLTGLTFGDVTIGEESSSN